MSIVIIGHVDSGKSTMTGHILFKLGVVSKQIMHKYEKVSEQYGKGSFKYAWVMDENEEERQRGVTIDIGTNYFKTKTGRQFTILDAPGHADFVSNMIRGTSQADSALLVLEASTGAFESGFFSGGTTKEHALICRSMGVTQIIVGINKLDLVNWSQERYEEI